MSGGAGWPTAELWLWRTRKVPDPFPTHVCTHTHPPPFTRKGVTEQICHSCTSSSRQTDPGSPSDGWRLCFWRDKPTSTQHGQWSLRGLDYKPVTRSRKLQHCTTSTSQTQNQTAWFSEAGLLHFPRALEIFWHNSWSAHCGQSQPWTVTIWERSTCTSWMSLISHLEAWPRVLKAESVLTGKVF